MIYYDFQSQNNKNEFFKFNVTYYDDAIDGQDLPKDPEKIQTHKT